MPKVFGKNKIIAVSPSTVGKIQFKRSPYSIRTHVVSDTQSTLGKTQTLKILILGTRCQINALTQFSPSTVGKENWSKMGMGKENSRDKGFSHRYWGKGAYHSQRLWTYLSERAKIDKKSIFPQYCGKKVSFPQLKWVVGKEINYTTGFSQSNWG